MVMVAERVSRREEKIVLEMSQRMRRMQECGKPLLIYFKKDIEDDMQKYCRGNKASIINYLVRLGLDALMKEQRKN